jgi:hypothetical protein
MRGLLIQPGSILYTFFNLLHPDKSNECAGAKTKRIKFAPQNQYLRKLLLFLAMAFSGSIASAQSYRISTTAGTGKFVYSGNGGAASVAQQPMIGCYEKVDDLLLIGVAV